MDIGVKQKKLNTGEFLKLTYNQDFLKLTYNQVIPCTNYIILNNFWTANVIDLCLLPTGSHGDSKKSSLIYSLWIGPAHKKKYLWEMFFFLFFFLHNFLAKFQVDFSVFNYQ